jgi:uncharacterized surface protein with fasciclin (FAS1) repeats
MKKTSIFAILFFVVLQVNSAFAQCNSGAQHTSRVSSKQLQSNDYGHLPANVLPNIVDIAVGSADHTTLVAALSAAGLVETLKGAGPFTVFAPTNAAFNKLPKGTVESLLKPESKATLTKILTYHVIAGNFDSKTLVNAIENNGGKITFKTLSGGKLTAKLDKGAVILVDEKGGISKISAVDLKGENGYIHVIDSVVMPK